MIIKICKILLAILSCISFLGVAFFTFIYFYDGFDYMYYSQGVVSAIFLACVIIALSLALLVLVIVLMFKGKIGVRITCTMILIFFIPVSMVAGFLGLAVNYFGPYGCSYTEDIANYGNYDYKFSTDYFPQSITEEMTVVDFSYFYKYVDTFQTDIYLEIKFSDRETMEKYLNTAKGAFSENGFLEYQNPYDSKYTDIIENQYQYGANSAYIEFTEDENYKNVEMHYYSVTYSYEELIIIYNYTGVGSDLEYGNAPEKGEYYPHYLTRFNVEFDPSNSFFK
ncbi:MAG: hypothetical protein IJ039_09195 [Clostridia bacterium]|nr:hypothetical protein [Clostridia bacterium]